MHRIRKAHRGFTLIEMLVVLFIIVVITAVVITGQSNYNKTLLLTDTTYGVALSARQAQSFGLASRKFGTVQNPGYGLHFSNATLGSYTLFADTASTLTPPSGQSGCPITTFNASLPPSSPQSLYKQGDCRFDPSNDGIVNTFTFSRGFSISKFCGKAGLARSCSTDSVPLTSLDLVFMRPNTSTVISGVLNGGSSPTTFDCADITITDPSKQATDNIRISSTGEISVNQTCP